VAVVGRERVAVVAVAVADVVDNGSAST
jgi:hypothetical protein